MPVTDDEIGRTNFATIIEGGAVSELSGHCASALKVMCARGWNAMEVAGDIKRKLAEFRVAVLGSPPFFLWKNLFGQATVSR